MIWGYHYFRKHPYGIVKNLLLPALRLKHPESEYKLGGRFVASSFGWIFWLGPWVGGPTVQPQNYRKTWQKCFICCFRFVNHGYMRDSSTDFQMVHIIVRDLRHYLGLYFFGPTETQESSMDSKSDLDCARQFRQCPVAFKMISSIVWVRCIVHRQCKGPRSKT